MDPQIETLLQLSAGDETTMLLDGMPDLQFGFHAQQAIEKLLKALIAAKGAKFPRTHDLEELVFLLEHLGESLPPVSVDPTGLTLYALDYRYGEPLPGQPPDHKDVIATVRTLREFIHRRIAALDSAASSGAPTP